MALKQIEFAPNAEQLTADAELLEHPRVGQEVVVARAGYSQLICRGGVAKITGGNREHITVDASGIFGRSERLRFGRTGQWAGYEASEFRRDSWTDCWHVHALTERALLFVKAAQREFEHEELESEVRLLAGEATDAQLRRARACLLQAEPELVRGRRPAPDIKPDPETMGRFI